MSNPLDIKVAKLESNYAYIKEKLETIDKKWDKVQQAIELITVGLKKTNSEEIEKLNKRITDEIKPLQEMRWKTLGIIGGISFVGTVLGIVVLVNNFYK